MDTITQEPTTTDATPSEEKTAPPDAVAQEPPSPKIADVIREIMKDTDLTEPKAIAKEVLNIVEEFDDEQLLELITSYVVVLTEAKRPTLSVVKGTGKGDQQITDREPKGRKPPQPSARVAAIQNWWQARLDERYVAANGGRKPLRELTMDDVIANRDKVKALSERLKQRVQAWDELAAAMLKHKVEKAGELTIEQVPQMVAAITPHA